MIAKQTKRIMPAERVTRRTETITESAAANPAKDFQDQVKKHS